MYRHLYLIALGYDDEEEDFGPSLYLVPLHGPVIVMDTSAGHTYRDQPQLIAMTLLGNHLVASS